MRMDPSVIINRTASSKPFVGTKPRFAPRYHPAWRILRPSLWKRAQAPALLRAQRTRAPYNVGCISVARLLKAPGSARPLRGDGLGFPTSRRACTLSRLALGGLHGPWRPHPRVFPSIQENLPFVKRQKVNFRQFPSARRRKGVTPPAAGAASRAGGRNGQSPSRASPRPAAVGYPKR